MGHPFKNFAAHLFHIPANSGTCSPWMATSAEFTANLIHIDPIIFRSHAGSRILPSASSSKNTCDNNGVDRSNVVNQAIDIVRLDLQALF